MKGYEIKYKAKDDNARVLLNHSIFGRLVYRNYRGRKYANYVPGYLDSIKFKRIKGGEIFVKFCNEFDIDYFREVVKIFGDTNIIWSGNTNFKEEELKTGEEHWTELAKLKDLPMKRGKKRW